MITRLKCQLSGDALHGSWSPLSINIINIINISRSYLVDPKSISVTIGARDQDCILAKRTGIFERWINKLRMGWRIQPEQCHVDPDIVRSIRNFFTQRDIADTKTTGMEL